MNQLSFSNIILGGDVQIKWRNIQHIDQYPIRAHLLARSLGRTEALAGHTSMIIYP